MFNLFKKENKNLNWSIEDVYNNPLSWFNDISKEQRLKTFTIKYIESDYLDKDHGLVEDYIVITPIKGFEDFKLFENFVSFQISKRNERLGLNKSFCILKPNETKNNYEFNFFPNPLDTKLEKGNNTINSKDISPELIQKALEIFKVYYKNNKDISLSIVDTYSDLHGRYDFELFEKQDPLYPNMPSLVDFTRIMVENLKEIIPSIEESKKSNLSNETGYPEKKDKSKESQKYTSICLDCFNLNEGKMEVCSECGKKL